MNFMHPHYKPVVYGGIGFSVMLAIGCLLASSWSSSESARLGLMQEKLQAAEKRASDREKEFGELNRRLVPVRAFSKAWAPFITFKPGVDVSSQMRTDLEMIAQRKLSLVTDQTVTPAPLDYAFQGQTYNIQRLSIRALGGNVNSLLTWLGEAEAAYPYARVERCTVQALSGANMAVVLSLAQPLPSNKKPTNPAAQ